MPGTAGARLAARRSRPSNGIPSRIITASLVESGRFALTDERPDQTTADALQEWRESERSVAVAKRGREAAELAAGAAVKAAAAAKATAEAARAALASATLAEASAAETASAADEIVRATRMDLTDATADLATTEVEEVAAQRRYREAAKRASSRE
jgi:hypothetical protein